MQGDVAINLAHISVFCEQLYNGLGYCLKTATWEKLGSRDEIGFFLFLQLSTGSRQCPHSRAAFIGSVDSYPDASVPERVASCYFI